MASHKGQFGRLKDTSKTPTKLFEDGFGYNGYK